MCAVPGRGGRRPSRGADSEADDAAAPRFAAERRRRRAIRSLDSHVAHPLECGTPDARNRPTRPKLRCAEARIMVNAALTTRQKLPEAASSTRGARRTRSPAETISYTINELSQLALARRSHGETLPPARWETRETGQRTRGANHARRVSDRRACVAALAFASAPAGAASRIKDLASVEGVRQNQLIGYGLVVGLNGTGDTLNNIPFTRQSLQAMLERLGVNIRGQTLRTGNVAAVMVTGEPAAFGTQGTRIDVTVSALGDAKSLQGGTLLVTPLLGADGNVYAVAQGSLAIGGFQAEGEAAKITRGVPTVGRIANGAIIEREIEFALNRLPQRAPRAAQRRLHHRQAHRRRHQRLHRRADRRAARSLDGAAHHAAAVHRQCRRAAHRDRAAADRAGHAAPRS